MHAVADFMLGSRAQRARAIRTIRVPKKFRILVEGGFDRIKGVCDEKVDCVDNLVNQSLWGFGIKSVGRLQ